MGFSCECGNLTEFLSDFPRDGFFLWKKNCFVILKFERIFVRFPERWGSGVEEELFVI